MAFHKQGIQWKDSQAMVCFNPSLLSYCSSQLQQKQAARMNLLVVCTYRYDIVLQLKQKGGEIGRCQQEVNRRRPRDEHLSYGN